MVLHGKVPGTNLKQNWSVITQEQKMMIVTVYLTLFVYW